MLIEHNGGQGSNLTAKQLKLKILADIAHHLTVYGRKEWDLIRERPDYAHLIGKVAGEAGRRKFWRWVDAVSSPPAADKTRPHEGTLIASAAMERATESARLAAQHLPAAPSPAYMMREGAKATQNIDFLAGVHRIWSDAERLRKEATEADENAPDGERIVDSSLFQCSISARIKVMETALRVMQEIWDLNFQQQYYDGITDILVTELNGLPEVQQRVIVRLRELNARRGMTVHAGSR